MQLFGDWIDQTVVVLDHRLTSSSLSPAERLKSVAAFAAMVLQQFLTIHPYVNGNGHAARFALWLILVSYGYWPQRFPIHPRPTPHDSYVLAIIAHRKGDPAPLERFILNCIVPWPAST
jgi:hypothetical protein